MSATGTWVTTKLKMKPEKKIQAWQAGLSYVIFIYIHVHEIKHKDKENRQDHFAYLMLTPHWWGHKSCAYTYGARKTSLEISPSSPAVLNGRLMLVFCLSGVWLVATVQQPHQESVVSGCQITPSAVHVLAKQLVLSAKSSTIPMTSWYSVHIVKGIPVN